MKVVFLTGYDDFKYAKRALGLQASEYLLKYEENDVILAAVKKACKDFDNERILSDRLEKSKILMKDKFFNDLITGTDDELAQRDASFLEIDFTGKNFCVAVINDKIWENVSMPDRQRSMELHLYSMMNICEETVKAFELKIFCIRYYNRICLLLNSSSGDLLTKEYIKKMLGKVIENIENKLRIDIVLGIGGAYEEYSSISRSYNEAVTALEVTDIRNRDEIIFSSEVKDIENSHSVLMKKIIEYINKNYSREELSLSDIANEVFISPTYISTLFKKYTGINFSDYLSKTRIKKAGELLEKTCFKTYEIAEKVGYKNPQYFSVLFKKLTGYSPTDYKSRDRI